MTQWEIEGVLVPAPPPYPWAVTHTLLPIVTKIGDGLRLHCSTRDERGRSRIVGGWLDLDRRKVAWQEPEALGLGSLGAFDDNGVTCSSIVVHDGSIFLYYTGWNLGVTVPFYLGIGCAVSTDGGLTFTRVSPAPVLGRSAVDPYLAGAPAVLVEEGLWRMWYVSGTEWRIEGGQVRHHYHIKYAESDDGIDWRPTGIVCIDYRDESETSIGRPCVLRDDGLYRMWFCARGEAYALGYAESDDGITWTRMDHRVGIGPSGEYWDSEMQAYPFVFDAGGARHLLYNGNGYGRTGIGHAVLRGH